MLGQAECECAIGIVIRYKDCVLKQADCQIGRFFLEEDVFEDSTVDFFEIADANKDGMLEYDELYAVS